MKAIDLFAGPGGWDFPARDLAMDVLGIEFDERTCQTREAAGLATVRADVSLLDPLDFGPIDLLIASPPCQTFSTAGKGNGRDEMADVLLGIDATARGERVPRPPGSDPRTWLVLEPMRWIVALQPCFVALEQVPAVLPVWERMAYWLHRFGFDVRTEILHAEMFGVPQTRKRAILVASREGPARLPAPTHSRYYPHDPKRLDPGVLPWVSMAEALGWQESILKTRGERAEGLSRCEYEHGRRSPVLTEKTRSWMRRDSGPGAEREPRAVDEAPSYTVRANGSGSNPSGLEWIHERPSPMVVGSRRSDEGMIIGRKLPEGEERNPAHGGWTLRTNRDQRDGTRQAVPVDNPAPTITSKALTQMEFGTGDEGGRTTAAQGHGVRVTIEEAALLQTFPASYPWHGTRSSIFQQIGNAIPPLFARRILETFVDG